MEGLGENPGNLVGVGDQVGVLGDRHGDADDVRFLERVGADHGAVDLPGDGNHGNGVHVRVGNGGHQVGGAGARRRNADTCTAGDHGVAFGRVAGALFVPDQDVPQLGGIHQRVIGRQDRSAGQTEDVFDSELFQRADDGLRTGHLGRRHDVVRALDAGVHGFSRVDR